MKEKVLEILTEHKGQSVSGSEIGRRLQLTRAAVWKSIKALQNEGVPITAVTNKGYCLAQSDDSITEAGIRQHLQTQTLGTRIEYFPVTDSTNIRAKLAAQEGAPAGYVAIAGCQTAGKGRFGRSFYSPERTGVYMSVLLRPDFEISQTALITAAVSVCTAEAIEALAGCEVTIKWVNDLFVGGKKVCGILTEAAIEFESAKTDYVVIGIGINITADDLPEELEEIVGGITKGGHSLGRCRLIAEILNRLEEMLEDFGPEKFIDAYRRRSNVIGKRVAIHRGNEVGYGLALDIDEAARLVVQTDEGEIRHLSSGEISCKVL